MRKKKNNKIGVRTMNHANNENRPNTLYSFGLPDVGKPGRCVP